MSFLQADWGYALPKAFLAIPKNIRLAFGCALLVNFFVFFYELAQFPIGDHDVGYMSGVAALSGGRAGRWFIPFLHILSGHVQIPVYTQFIAFCTLIAAGMGAVLLWWPKANFLPLFTGGVVVSCMPVVTEFYYYHWMAPAFTCSQLFMVLALHCTLTKDIEQTPQGVLGLSLWRWTAAIVLATCAMATYQSAIITWATCFCGLCAARLWQWDGQGKSLWNTALGLLPAIGAILVACVLYSVSLRLYPLVGLTLELYQFDTVPLSTIVPRTIEVVRQSYIHLWTPQPFMPPYLKGLLLFISVTGCIVYLYDSTKNATRTTCKSCLLLLLLALLPIAAKIQFIISANDSWHSARFAGMGLSYVHLFFLVGLLSATATLARNVGLALFALLLPAMAINCLNEQVQLVRSNTHDISVLNRVVNRLEQLPNYDPEKTYNLVQLGRTPVYEPRGNVPPEWGQLNATISQAWSPGFELWLISSYLKLGDRLNEDAFIRPDLLAKALNYAQDKKPFPHSGAVGIVDDTIVLYFDEKALALAQARLKKGH